MNTLRIDDSDLQALIERLEKSPETVKRAKAAAFKRAAPKLKTLIDSEIGGTGRVKSWQEARVGDLGGYAAVGPKARTYAQDRRGNPTKYAVAYVTRAINNGHRFPGLRGGGEKTRRYRITAGKVPGLHFYDRAQTRAPEIARQTAEEIVAEVVGELEG